MMRVFLCTIAMEKNRWSTKIPSFAVSDFVERAVKDGFDGLELWENHLLLADSKEQEKLYGAGIPWIYNTYLRFDQGVTSRMREIADVITRLNPEKVKLNLSASECPVSKQVETLLAFAGMIPDRIGLLSECHPGTPMENPEDACRVFEMLPAERFGAIVHLAPDLGENARRFELYGNRICHLHSQLRRPGAKERTRLDAQPGVARDHLCALRAWGFCGSASIEFTQDGNTPEETYENCVADMHMIRETLG